MLPNNFQPSDTFALIRLGSKYDGGYLVEKHSVAEAKTLLSFGIHDNWLFEKQFVKTNKIPLYAYDDESGLKLLIRNIVLSLGECFFKFRKPVQSLRNFILHVYNPLDHMLFFRGNRVINHVKVGYDSSNSESLVTILSNGDIQYPIFIKCDIEGWEYRILDEVIDHSEKICGLVIEFHDVDLHIERIKKFIENFSLELVHIHPNNYGGLDDKHNPIAIEMTFAKSPKKVASTPLLPHPKDTPNDPDERDILLKFD